MAKFDQGMESMVDTYIFETTSLLEQLDQILTVPHSYAPAHMSRQRAASVAALGMVLYREISAGAQGCCQQHQGNNNQDAVIPVGFGFRRLFTETARHNKPPLSACNRGLSGIIRLLGILSGVVSARLPGIGIAIIPGLPARLSVRLSARLPGILSRRSHASRIRGYISPPGTGGSVLGHGLGSI